MSAELDGVEAEGSASRTASRVTEAGNCAVLSSDLDSWNVQSSVDTLRVNWNAQSSVAGLGVDGPVIPTEETYIQLQTGYNYINNELCDNKLPNCLITLQRRGRTYGYYVPKRFTRRSDARRTDEIALNPKHFSVGTLEILSTLAHEMKHLEQQHFGNPGRGRYHNKEWAKMMKDIGLIPSDTGKVGGKETGDTVSHYIEPGGRFERVVGRLLATGFEITWIDDTGKKSPPPDGNGTEGGSGSRSGRRTKYICRHPDCTLKAWAKADASLLCGMHGLKMDPAG